MFSVASTQYDNLLNRLYNFWMKMNEFINEWINKLTFDWLIAVWIGIYCMVFWYPEEENNVLRIDCLESKLAFRLRGMHFFKQCVCFFFHKLFICVNFVRFVFCRRSESKPFACCEMFFYLDFVGSYTFWCLLLFFALFYYYYYFQNAFF